MRLAGCKPTSLYDGIGLNYVVYFQGCRHQCKQCQNPTTWAMDGGVEVSLEALQKHIKKYISLISGVTLSGGDPVYQLEEALKLAYWAKAQGLQVTLYTGFELRDVLDKAGTGVEMPFDYVVDGRYEEESRSRELAYRGSANQKIWKKEGKSYEEISKLIDKGDRRKC